jgi:hypothetical protein
VTTAPATITAPSPIVTPAIAMMDAIEARAAEGRISPYAPGTLHVTEGRAELDAPVATA